MKKHLCFAVLLVTVSGLSARADETNALTKNIGPDNTGRFGAGVIIGEPIGGSVKFWLNDTMALDGAVGWSSEDHTDLYVHSDFLWHNFELIPVSKGSLPVYFGGGGLVRFREGNRDNQAGIRAPVGVSYIFDDLPIDIFAEIGPALDVTPDVKGEITGGIGARYWF